MQNSKKPWVSPSVRQLSLSPEKLAELFPKLTPEQRDRIAAKSGGRP